MTECLKLFSLSGLSGVPLQNAVDEQFPNGECEIVNVSEHSPGPVGAHEALVRLIFNPIHVDGSGQVVSVAFNDAWTSDLSVFRDEMASDQEILHAIEQIKMTGLQKNPPRERHVVQVRSARTVAVRKEILPKSQTQAFRVYDTAEADKPHHASVFLTKAARDELTEKSTRKRLFELFSTVANNYRGGRFINQK